MTRITKKYLINELSKDNLIGFLDVLKTDRGEIEIYITNYYDDGIEIYNYGKIINLIVGVHLYNENEKNLGFGKELYIKALNKYNKLYSTFPISDEAFYVHKSLIKNNIIERGFEKLADVDFLTMELKKI